MKAPLVSVIVINMNGCEFLRPCLLALRHQTFRDFETILVDNGSSDDSLDVVRQAFPEVTVLALEKNYGFGGGNNRGIGLSKGRYVALLNNDTQVDACWLAELVTAMDGDPGVGMCASKIVFADDPQRIDSAGDELFWFGQTFTYRHYSSDYPFLQNPRRCFSACAGAALYRRSVLDETGLFDDIYFPACYEDVDLGFRAQLLGYEAVYVPTATVHHKGSATVRKTPGRGVYLNHRNLNYLVYINLPGILLLKYAPMRFLYACSSLVYHCISGNALHYLRAQYDFLRNLRKVLVKRKQVQNRRKISPKQLETRLHRGWFAYRMRVLLGIPQSEGKKI